MDGFVKKRIKDFAFTASGGTPSTKKSEFWEGGTIPWINSGELSQNDFIETPSTFITKLGLENSSAKLMPVGSVVIALTGATTGMSAFLKIETSGNQSITGIYPSKEHDGLFLFYYIKHHRNDFLKLNIGSAQPHINKKIVDEFEVVIPKDVTEQSKIATILSSLDSAIATTEQLIVKYQHIKTGLLHDLLTCGIDEHGNLRNEKTHQFKDCKLGRIPVEWEPSTIGKACFVRNEFRLPLSQDVRGKMQGDYRYYGPTGIFDYIDEYRVEGKYVLIGEDGDHFLKHKSQEQTILVEGKFNVNNHAHILEGSKDCLTEWIHLFFSHRDITLHLTRQGAGRYKLNKTSLLNIDIALPKIDEQKEILKRVETLKKKYEQDKLNLTKLQSLKTGLMQDLLSGKVRVKCNI